MTWAHPLRSRGPVQEPWYTPLGPVAAAFANAPEPGPAASQPATPAASSQTAATPPAPTRQAFTIVEHVVGPTDTLSGLARSHLGDADRWPAIFEASRGIPQPDGQHLTNPDLIIDGWTLHIPVPITTTGAGQTIVEHTVNTGDTLSGAARAYLGDADRWPEIYEASRGIEQPDGQQLNDPDLILDGWTLHIPAQPTAESSPQPAAGNASTNAGASEAPAEPTVTSADAEREAPAPTVGALPPSAPAPAQPDTRETPVSSSQPAPDEAEEIEQTPHAPWLLAGMSSGGFVLAAGTLLTLRRRRRQQFRERRPGRAIALPEARLVPVEKTTTAVGTTAETTVRFMDEVLRQLAASLMSDGQQMPSLSAVELRADGSIVLHLAEPATLGAPWVARDAASTTWQLPAGAYPTAVGFQYEDQPAPFPLLVTCGCTDAGDLWLANLEQLGAVRVTGNQEFCRDYLRYVVAELAVNPWSLNTTITCAGMDDLAPLSPERVRTAPRIDEAVEQLSFRATANRESVTELHTDSATARVAQLAEEVWGARILIADGDFTDEPRGMSALIDVITTNQGKTSAAVIASETAMARGLEFEFTDHGRVTIPDLGLDLIAVGLTQDEALGCAALLSVGTATQDTAMPTNDDEEGWRALADQAGALRQDLTVPRSTPDTEPVSCMIDEDDPLPDSAIEADLDALDPKVPTDVRAIVEQTDPGLDEDVTDWFSERCTRPRLSLLGPVTVRAHGAAVAKRKPFYTEVLSFIALRQRGATTDELATALGYTNITTVRTAVKAVRDWLGTNPRTGRPHLPAANATVAAKQRGIPAYQVEDLLIDVGVR